MGKGKINYRDPFFQTMEHELNKKAVQIETLRRLAASLSVSIGSQSEFRTEQKSIVHVIKHIGHMWRQVNELLLTREKTTTSDGSAEDKVLEIKEEQNQVSLYSENWSLPDSCSNFMKFHNRKVKYTGGGAQFFIWTISTETGHVLSFHFSHEKNVQMKTANKKKLSEG